MVELSKICLWLDQQAPLGLSEPWDNTGLLLGDDRGQIRRVQTCLTLSSATAREAIERQADLVVCHHPLPLKPFSKITTATSTGKLLWDLARHSICVYSPHTAWDSAEMGINAMIAQRLGLKDVVPLVASQLRGLEHLGAGRLGRLKQPCSMHSFCQQVSRAIPHCRMRGVDSAKSISTVAIACGSGGSLLEAAVRLGCDLFLTGEATYHACLEAESSGVSMLLIGHFASEHFAMVELADRIRRGFPEVECWCSESESDPVKPFTMH